MITLETKKLSELQFNEIFLFDERELFVKTRNDKSEMVVCTQIGFVTNGRMKVSIEISNTEHFFHERQVVSVFSY
jgi:hypothetical protein